MPNENCSNLNIIMNFFFFFICSRIGWFEVRIVWLSTVRLNLLERKRELFFFLSRTHLSVHRWQFTSRYPLKNLLNQIELNAIRQKWKFCKTWIFVALRYVCHVKKITYFCVHFLKFEFDSKRWVSVWNEWNIHFSCANWLSHMCSTKCSECAVKWRRHLPKATILENKQAMSGRNREKILANSVGWMRTNPMYGKTCNVYLSSICFDVRSSRLRAIGGHRNRARSRSFKLNLFLCDDWCTMIATTHTGAEIQTQRPSSERARDRKQANGSRLTIYYHYHARRRIVLNKPNG